MVFNSFLTFYLSYIPYYPSNEKEMSSFYELLLLSHLAGYDVPAMSMAAILNLPVGYKFKKYNYALL